MYVHAAVASCAYAQTTIFIFIDGNAHVDTFHVMQKNLHNQVYNARSIYNYFKQQEEDAKREEERKAKQRQYKQNTRNSRHEKHRERTCSENKLALEEAMKTLGISKPFTIEQLKKIRKQLAVKYHPDQGGSVEMCAKINAAFDLLKDHVAA